MRFRICPRCDTVYLFKRYECGCGFENYINNDNYYAFKTKKYHVIVSLNLKKSLIESVEKKPKMTLFASQWHGVQVPVMAASIPKILSPEASEEDIDKLLLLL
jgi:hypothetical protein